MFFVRKIFYNDPKEKKRIRSRDFSPKPEKDPLFKERRLRSRSSTRHTDVGFTVYMRLVFVQRSIVNRHEPGPRVIVTNVRISIRYTLSRDMSDRVR